MLRLLVAFLPLAAALAGCSSRTPEPAAAAAAPPALTGTVSDAARSPLPGAFVTVTGADRIERTVYARADGRYAFDSLPAAPVVVRAHAPGYDAVQATADGAGPTQRVDLALAKAADPLAGTSTSLWLSTLPDGEMKREFILNCATCHEITRSRVELQGKVRDREGWADAIRMMKALDVYAVVPPDFDTDRYAGWLAAHLSPEAIARLTPRVRPLPPADEAVTITEYPLPKADELPHDLVVGPDGRIWVTAFWHSEMWALDPATGAVETFEVAADKSVPAQVRALEFDRNGVLWIVNGGSESVVRLDPKTRRYDTFKVGMYPHDLVIDSRGDIWVNDYFSNPERMARVSAANGKVTVFPLPSANLPASQGKPLPYGLQVDAADRLWSTQLAANTLARHDIASGEAKLYTMPNPNSGPRRTAIGLDGRVWIPEFNSGRLAAFDPKTETFEVHDLGDAAAGAYDVVVDPTSGDVWIGAALATELIRFDVRTKTFTRYPLPTEPAFMRHLAVDPATGDVWSAYSSLPTAVPKVVRLSRRPVSAAPRE